MNDKVYITSEFKEILENLKIGTVDYITVYRIENDKVFFKANRGRFHLTLSEFEEVKLK
jgi:hypothetical protein